MGISACRTGWSEWINTHHPKDGGSRNDVEPIPDRLNPVRVLMSFQQIRMALMIFVYGQKGFGQCARLSC